MYKVILFVIEFGWIVQIGFAQDSITVNDVRVIKAKSEITIQRYFNILLNTISYTGSENTDIKELINVSLENGEKKLFLNKQVLIADDISDPNYRNSSSPEISVSQYLNAFNTFYAKSDTNSVFFSDVRTSQVKKGKMNLYIDVYFTSFFRNKCLSNPATPYKPVKRVAELLVRKGNDNKWLLYISRIGFFNPADTVNEYLHNVVVATRIMQTDPSRPVDGSYQGERDSVGKYRLYIEQARLEEKKRNYQKAIVLYTRAVALQPKYAGYYDSHIRDLNTSLRILSDLEEKFQAGYYKTVLKEYSDYLKKPRLNSNVSNSDYYLGRGKCFDRLGQLTKSYNEQVKNYSDALQDYTKSYEYDNDNLATIQSTAELYVRMDRRIEALTEYKTYLAKDPTEIAVYEAMSDIHMFNGNIDEALKNIETGLSQDSIDLVSKSRLLVDKGILYARKRDFSVAEGFFTNAIGLDSNNALAYYTRGIARINLNKLQSASGDFSFARQKGLYSTKVHYTTAMESSTKFTGFREDEVSSFDYEIGNVYMNLGKYDSAYSYLLRSYQRDSTNGYILYSMASCIYLQGDTKESLVWFERAFKARVFEKSYVEHDVLLASLQDDKNFKVLKKKYL
jgi:tetratricopeptide (TPR) repeat protein